MGTVLSEGRPFQDEASFNRLLNCIETKRAGRVGRPGTAAVCGARRCRCADPTLNLTRRTKRSDKARPSAVEVLRSCLIIPCCTGGRLPFPGVDSLSVVTVIVVLPSAVCPY